ncbi:hypothetical protein AUI07_02690 [archaeon 13_2_20CM_2_53_6]|nr:MAG: hypothetical protein AUI07_02690 [archaeon 13_2_20CM_2_53_6]
MAAKVCLALLALVFAASVTVSTTTYQAQVGSTVNVTNSLLATDKGFTIATTGSSSSGASCSAPVTFGPSPGVANTDITAGHLVYDVQVNSTSTAQSNTQFNVTFVLGSTVYGPLCIQTPSPSLDGQIIDCKFDIGSNSLPSSPYSFRVIIA